MSSTAPPATKTKGGRMTLVQKRRWRTIVPAVALLVFGALDRSRVQAQADPCQDPNNIRILNGCTSDAAAGRLRSALDSPAFTGPVTLKTAPVSEFAQRLGDSWLFRRFELDFGDSVVTPGAGSVSGSSLPLRQRLWPHLEQAFSAPASIDWESRGVRLGHGVT